MKPKIVITGGPSGGKTTLIDGLKKELGTSVGLVPEAASLIYRGGFPRVKQSAAWIPTQRAIFFVQQELESLVKLQSKKAKLIVCDRGSLDGIAYWPKSETDFFNSLNTNRKTEIDRYQWVLHLDTAPKKFYDTTNPVRTENFLQAQRLNSRVRRAWRDHPQRFIITDQEDFMTKLRHALTVIEAILENKPYEQIQQILKREFL